MNNFGSLGLLRGPWSATRVVRRPLRVVGHYGGPRDGDGGGAWSGVSCLFAFGLQSSVFGLVSLVLYKTSLRDVPSIVFCLEVLGPDSL